MKFWMLLFGLSMMGGCSKDDRNGEYNTEAHAQNGEPLPSQIPNAQEPSKQADADILNKSKAKQRVEQRLTKWLGDFAKLRKIPMRQAQAAWRDAWLPTFEAKLPSSSAVAVLRGEVAPTEMQAITKPSKSLILQVRDGTFSLAETSDEAESLMCLHTLIFAVMLDGAGQLPDLLSSQSDKLPPSRGDILIYQMVDDATDGLEVSSEPISQLEAASWRKLGTARNPVYRRIGLLLYPRIAGSAEAELELYRACAAETDDLNLMMMVRNLESLSDSAGFLFLREFISRLDATRHPRVAAEVIAAIGRIKSLNP